MTLDDSPKSSNYNQTMYFSCSWLARTDPADVARVESKTVICTENQRETIPTPKDGVKGQVGIWMSPQELSKQFSARLPGCMKGRFDVPSTSPTQGS